MNVGEFCNREVVICNSGDSMVDAAKKMRKYHVGDLVVVEERQGLRVPIGILTDRDIVIEIIAEEVDMTDITVGDFMSYDLTCATVDDEIIETIKLMHRKGIRRLPIINRRGGLEGIITMDNIIDLMAELLNDLSELTEQQPRREDRKYVRNQ